MAVSAQNERSTVVKTRFTLRLLSLAALGSLIVAGGNCADQREPECTSPAAGHFTVRLEPAGAIPAGCESTVQTAIVLAARSFYNLDGDGNVDYDQPFKVAIQTIEMGEQYAHLETDAEDRAGIVPDTLIATNKLYAYGQFTAATPDGNDQCYIPTLTEARLESPELARVDDDPETEEDDEFLPQEAAHTRAAEWSNVTFLVSTAYPGVQFQGTVTLTRPVFEDVTEPAPTMDDPEATRVIGQQLVNTCSITYTAIGVSAVNNYDCSVPPDADDPETPENENPLYWRPEGYNQALCAAEADFSQGIEFGSGINPDFPIICDPETKLCLLNGPFKAGVQN
jgi:hypothetical protein